MIDKLRKHQFKFLNYLFEDMYPVKSKYYPDSTFFKKDDKVTLELEKSGTLWVLYSVWTDIADMFSLDYNETQQLIKAWMEQQIKSKKVTPTRISGMYDFRTAMVEEQLKSEEVTPKRSNEIFPAKMELQLKSEEVTPLLTIWNYEEMIEEQLKQEEVIPHTSITNQLMRVQEELKSVEIKPVKDVNLICQLAELRLNREEITPTISTSYRLEEKLKSVEITPLQGCVSPFSMDSEELTPQRMDYVIIGEIEEELEPVEITPDIKGHSGSYWAESLLKSEEITPRSAIAPPFRWRELDSEEITPKMSRDVLFYMRDKI